MCKMSKSLELICDINLIHVKLDSGLKRSQSSSAFQHGCRLSVPVNKTSLNDAAVIILYK